VYLHLCHCFLFSLHEGHTLCSVSSQNIVAFTTTTELEDVSGKTWGSHVYVADLNTPWYSHKYVRTEYDIFQLNEFTRWKYCVNYEI